jgi:hypothetical protein
MQVQYLCPPSDATACWTSLTSTSLGLIQPDTAFDDDSLYEYIRKPAALAGTGLNDMPKAPTEVYEFTEADLARITAWVAAGAHND